MHCHRYHPTPLTRRELLMQAAFGFGGVALTVLAADKAFGEQIVGGDSGRDVGGDSGRRPSELDPKNPHAPRPPHFAAKAKSVIFLYMDGGPSQVDTFDPKPLLTRHHGKSPYDVIGRVEETQFNSIGNIFKSPWAFKQYGESGISVSDLFPNIAKHVDNMAVLRGMISPFSEHTNANYFLHTGIGVMGRPSHGAWFTYGLGSENQNLPGFVILNGGLIPPGGLDNFGSGFLPAAYQGSMFRPGGQPVANIAPQERTPELQRGKLDLMRQLDQTVLGRVGRVDALESAIANYELAARMQTAVPELMDINAETPATLEMYGLHDSFANTKIYGQLCLTARRLVERGVRFIEITCPDGNGDRWDQHGNLVDGHGKNAHTVDQPIAALLTDLKRRGLLKETLVVFCGEFGRTPFAQGDGRDHNPLGFSIWLAGGGIKGGTVYGATDEFGYRAIEGKTEIHDLHATMLHLCGIDHTRLTYRWGGRDMRLTDVHGHVVQEILA